jgi:iron complex outermembrane receptor protein
VAAWLIGIAVLTTAPASIDQAKSGNADPDESGEIIVTGERVTRSLKDTPSSVAVFTQERIKTMAEPDRLQQLLEFVPNVLVSSSRDTPIVRGQDSIGVLQGLPGFLGGARPRTTVQVDGRAVGYSEFAFGMFGLWDVDRVEVFRSPQTTTQGPNAIAGAIFIQTADPTYDFETRLRAIGGQAHTRQLSGVISAPIVDEQLAFRISGDLRRSHTSSELSGTAEGVNLNHDRYGAVRAKLLIEPNAISNLRLLLTYAHNQSAAPQIESVRRPLRARRDSSVRYGYFKIDEDTLIGAMAYPITPTLQWRTTATWGDGHIRRFAPPRFGESRAHGRDHSLESILQWKPDGPISALGGVHLLAQNLDQRIDLRAANFGIGEFKDRQRGRGVFGEMTWRGTSGISVTGGLRYQSDSKVRFGGLQGGGVDTAVDFDRLWHAWLPKLTIAYDLNKDVRVGAMVLRAYNPGGVSLDLLSRSALEFEPEYLWDYELFARASMLGGRLTFNANLFYNDIRDAQRQLDIPVDSPGGAVGLIAVSNAPRARSYGAEAELGYKLSPKLSVRAAIGLLHTRLTKTLSTRDPILGKEFARAPGFTGTAGINWEPLRGFEISSQIRHNSGYFGDDANSPVLHINGSTTVDAKASWGLRQFTVFTYAQNVFDEFHMTYWEGGVDPHGSGVANDPREIGIGIDASF